MQNSTVSSNLYKGSGVYIENFILYLSYETFALILHELKKLMMLCSIASGLMSDITWVLLSKSFMYCSMAFFGALNSRFSPLFDLLTPSSPLEAAVICSHFLASLSYCLTWLFFKFLEANSLLIWLWVGHSLLIHGWAIISLMVSLEFGSSSKMLSISCLKSELKNSFPFGFLRQWASQNFYFCPRAKAL